MQGNPIAFLTQVAAAWAFTVAAANADFIKLPINDVDKSHTAGNWGSNWYDDVNGNGQWDLGEPYADSADPSWKTPLQDDDNSCWLASAANMLGSGGWGDANAIYQSLLNQFGWTEDSRVRHSTGT